MGFLKAIDTLSEKSGKLFSWFLVIIMVIVMYDVITRRLFQNPSTWGFEVTFMLWGAYFLMVMAWTELEGGHVNIDVLCNRFPPRVKTGLSFFLYLTVCLVWVGAMVKGGIDFASVSWIRNEHTLTIFGPPIYPLKTVIPVAFILLGLQALARCTRNLVILTRKVE